MTSTSLPPLPSQIEGIIFTEVLIPLIRPEIDPQELVRLGATVRKKGNTELYKPLTASLRKIQMAKLASMRAKQIELQLDSEFQQAEVVVDPVAHIEHSLNVTDCIVHTKSALDSMAVFLADFFSLNAKGGDIDFKKLSFRQKITDPVLGPHIAGLSKWFEDIQIIRDAWIHRTTFRSFVTVGKSSVGRMPISKDTYDEHKPALPKSLDRCVSTTAFVDEHYSKLVNLFNMIVRRSIELESSTLTEPVPVPSDAERQMSMFPVFVSENTLVSKMKVGSLTAGLFRQ